MNDKIRRMFCNQESISYKVFLFLATHQDEDYLHKTSLSRDCKVNYTSLCYWITKFNEEGLIDREYKLTPAGNKLFSFIWNGKDVKLLRAHNIQIKFELSACPPDYIRRYSDSVFTLFTNKRFRGLKGKIGLRWDEIGIMIYSRKKVVCVVQDIFGEDDEDISGAICEIVPHLVKLIEKRFNGIKVSNYVPARIQTSHIALLDSTVSKRFQITGQTYEGENIAVDMSHGEYEFELTNPKNNLGGIALIKEIEEKLSQSDLKDNKKDKNSTKASKKE